EPCAVALGVNSCGAAPHGRDQPLILVKSKRARRHPKFTRHIGNTERLPIGGIRGFDGDGMLACHARTLSYVYVNVKSSPAGHLLSGDKYSFAGRCDRPAPPAPPATTTHPDHNRFALRPASARGQTFRPSPTIACGCVTRNRLCRSPASAPT